MVQPLSGEMSLFDKLILGVRLLHPVFLSDMLRDVNGVISSADRALSNCCLGLLRMSFRRQKIWDFDSKSFKVGHPKLHW